MAVVYTVVEAMGGRFSLETGPRDWPALQRFLSRPFGPKWRECTEREALAVPMMGGREWLEDMKREGIA